MLIFVLRLHLSEGFLEVDDEAREDLRRSEREAHSLLSESLGPDEADEVPSIKMSDFVEQPRRAIIDEA